MERNARTLRYFYLNSNLYKILRINRPADIVEVWNYRDWKREGFIWSDVRKNAGIAYPVGAVSKMLNRKRITIELYILEGKIPAPQRAFTIDEEKKPGKYLFSEKDVLDLHSYLLTVHRGRPRADGKIYPQNMPTRNELRAMMKNDTILYVKGSDNKFVPAWMEESW